MENIPMESDNADVSLFFASTFTFLTGNRLKVVSFPCTTLFCENSCAEVNNIITNTNVDLNICQIKKKNLIPVLIIFSAHYLFNGFEITIAPFHIRLQVAALQIFVPGIQNDKLGHPTSKQDGFTIQVPTNSLKAVTRKPSLYKFLTQIIQDPSCLFQSALTIHQIIHAEYGKNRVIKGRGPCVGRYIKFMFLLLFCPFSGGSRLPDKL
jgi:hypothetical protein